MRPADHSQNRGLPRGTPTSRVKSLEGFSNGDPFTILIWNSSGTLWGGPRSHGSPRCSHQFTGLWEAVRVHKTLGREINVAMDPPDFRAAKGSGCSESATASPDQSCSPAPLSCRVPGARRPKVPAWQSLGLRGRRTVAVCVATAIPFLYRSENPEHHLSLTQGFLDAPFQPTLGLRTEEHSVGEPEKQSTYFIRV